MYTASIATVNVDGVVTMVGSPLGLRTFADWLEGAPSDSTLTMTGGEGHLNPDVEARKIVVAEGQVTVSADGAVLLFTGTGTGLGLLADSVRFASNDGSPRSHLHIEYYPDHPWLAAAAMPLIIEVDAASDDGN